MEKPIKFQANLRSGIKPHLYPTGWIPVPDDIYGLIPTHHVGGRCESIERFTVTLSPASPEPKRRVGQEPEPKPDYEAMWKELKAQHDPKGFPTTKMFELQSVSAKDFYNFMVYVEAKHTPPGAEKPEGKDEEAPA